MESKSDKKNAEEDAKYVVACQSGDETAWNALYFKYRPQLIGFFKNKGVVHEDAEELAQDTLLEAFKSIGTIRRPKSFKAWLFTIAERKRAKWFEAQRKELEREPLRWEVHEIAGSSSGNRLAEIGIQASYPYQQPESTQPERIATDKEQLSIVYGLIANLPKKQRDVMQLIAQELSSKEIADMLNLKVGNVEVRVHRARKELKKRLRTKYPEIAEEQLSNKLIQLLTEK